MATDTAALLDQILQGQELIDGLRNEMPNFDDKVCTVRPVDSLSGVIPYLAAKDTMGRDDGAQAVGDNLTESEFELSSIAYACQQFGRKLYIPKAVVQDMDQYMSTLGEIVQTLLENNAISREVKLAALMTNASFNGQQPAGSGAWSLSTSTPVKDILNLKLLKVPKIDMCVIGATSAVELAVHADITAMAGMGFASGGAVPTEGLQNIVASLLRISPADVHIWDTFYNSANEGQTAALGRVTGDFFWAGQQKGLLKIAQKGMQAQLSLIEGHTSYSQGVTDVCVHKRVESFLGGEMTGI